MVTGIIILDEKESLNRPAWTQDDLHAYKHKHTLAGKTIENYYIKTKGCK